MEFHMKGGLLGIRVSALIPHHWEIGVMVHFYHWVEVLALKEPAPVSKVQRPPVKMPEVCPLTEADGPGACSIYGFRPLVPGMTMVPYVNHRSRNPLCPGAKVPSQYTLTNTKVPGTSVLVMVHFLLCLFGSDSFLHI